MFNLEQSIVDWRQRMLAAGIRTPAPLEELESHLRDDIEQRVKSGVPLQQAFENAIQQIGKANMLNKEFKKVEETKEDCDHKLLQILLAVVTILVPLLLGSMVLFKIGSFSQLTFGQQLSELAAVAIFPLLVYGGRLGCGFFSVIRARRIKNAIICSCGVLTLLWWLVFVHLILPRYDFTIGQLMVTTLWAFIPPGGALAGLILGIEIAARKKVAVADVSAGRC
jgi:hypothetical protein